MKVPAWLPGAAVLVVAAIGVTFVQQRTPPTDVAEPTGLRGTLVYAANDHGAVRLFLWNLGTGAVSEGPEVPSPLALVDAFEAASGTIGLVWETPSGQEAGVLRHLGARDTWAPAVEGDLVAWAPGGRFVSAVSLDAAGTGCRAVVRTFEVASADMVGEATAGATCGKLVAFVRSRSDPYVTIRIDGLATTRPLGAPAIAALDGWVPVGISPLGTFLVAPDQDAPAAPRPLAWFSRAFGSPSEPRPYGTRPRLLFERILGWQESRGAYVLGLEGEVRGIYLASADAGSGAPLLVAEVAPTAHVRLTQTAAGTPLVAIDGAFYRVSAGELAPMPLPSGAPAPTGPILWLPTVADSSG